MARLIRVKAEPAWGWCGGLRHPPQAEYPVGALTEAQLRDMRADPSLTVEEIDEQADAEALRLAAEATERAEAERRASEDAARAEAEPEAEEAAARAAIAAEEAARAETAARTAVPAEAPKRRRREGAP